MIGYLQGQILSASEGKIVVGIGHSDSGFVGYSLLVPQSMSYLELHKGMKQSFFVHTHVREDAFDLFGFLTEQEKEIFQTLTSVSGIGPRTGLGILSAVDAGTLVRALITEDRAVLTALPGIGKKTAERLILELKEKLAKQIENGASFTSLGGGKITKASINPVFDEAKVALIGLGFKDADVQMLLAKALEDFPGIQRVEDLIKLALKKPAPHQNRGIETHDQ